MAETLTPNYGWTKPDPGASANTWGTTLNATTDKIDAQVHLNQLAGVPVGSGALWFTDAPPANWLICDGSSLSTTTYAALFNAWGGAAGGGYRYGGSGANFNLPNLVGKFPLGGSLAQTGGEAAHTLLAGEMPAHAHPITDVAHNHGVNQWYHDHGYSQTPHAHNGTQDPHNHNYAHTTTGHQGLAAGGSFVGEFTDVTSTAQPAVHIDAQYANISFTGQTTAISLNASGTGLTTTQNAGSNVAHNNMPPWIGVNFIVKFQ